MSYHVFEEVCSKCDGAGTVHQGREDCDACEGNGKLSHGSFEVFEVTDPREIDACPDEGWYWWACFPGCLPDGDPCGPFATEQEAIEDANGGDYALDE